MVLITPDTSAKRCFLLNGISTFSCVYKYLLPGKVLLTPLNFRIFSLFISIFILFGVRYYGKVKVTAKNSDNAGLMKKLAAMQVCGIIATHDVTIGEQGSQYPGYMATKCFEAQIINDELLFDYKLKDGVCQKLSASFLMKKMEIID